MGTERGAPVPIETAPGLWTIDLQFGGRSGVIAAYLLADPSHDGELALIECGPASTIDRLVAGIEASGHDPRRLRRILLTHIHLDHAGGAGILAARLPDARVLVHEAGARHLIDPTRLLASAALIYGDRMEELWGTTLPVPAAQVQVVADGEELVLPGRTVRALYTPGHARHHIAYHDPASRAVFSGDVGGVRLQGSAYVRPPTPPPDLDLDAWDASIARLAALDPRTLYLTHFGACDGVPAHFAALRERLHAWAGTIGAALEAGATPEAIAHDLAARENPVLQAESSGDDVVRAYDLASNYEMNVAGYLRFLTRGAPGKAPA